MSAGRPKLTVVSTIVRVLSLGLAICGILFGLQVLPSARRAEALQSIGMQLLRAESFPAAQLRGLPTGAEKLSSCETEAQVGLALAALMQAEETLATGRVEELDETLAALSMRIEALLRCSPHQPFFWLIRFWTQAITGTFEQGSWRMLEESYRLGPNEGWIATRRNRYALNLFLAVPEGLRPTILREFATLVRDGYLWESAKSYAKATEGTRALLRTALMALSERQRRAFAVVLEQAGIEDPALRNSGPTLDLRFLTP